MIEEQSVVDKIGLSHLDSIKKSVVEKLITGYEPKQTIRSPVEMKIILEDDVPIFQHPRRTSYENRVLIDKQVQEWLDAGIVIPSCSEYASPVVLVSKKDGSKRFCCDYRRLNLKIKRDNFPMALIDDVLDRLQGSKVLTTLDLANGFFHVPIEVESRKFTSFVTINGQYEFTHVPFGISNSPQYFAAM